MLGGSACLLIARGERTHRIQKVDAVISDVRISAPADEYGYMSNLNLDVSILFYNWKPLIAP